ncbi:MAG: phosphate ABC transporter permease subunit PstC [Albidovulum sp.]|nr:phosphate ABC transporter permease subunit PstC [Albidovulum sp.]MDE0305052.1 phosphate ABC transporter permease subunit PstC [Albidovulum sp.]MDE0532834.1 phosphate ABC transporter permease subunit PstC [Albidovulum sp.]
MIAFIVLLLFAISGYILNRISARAIRDGGTRLHSVPGYHGLFSFFVVFVPVFVLILLWLALQGPVLDAIVMGRLPPGTLDDLGTGARQLLLAEIKSIAGGRIFGQPEDWKLAAGQDLVEFREFSYEALLILTAIFSAGLLIYARRKVSSEFRARHGVERIVSGLMILCSVVAIFTTIGIIASLLVETGKFLALVPLSEFLFGLNWEPQIPIREDQIAAEGAFGWIPVFAGTLVITVVALLVAVPVGLMSAIYLNEFAPRRVRASAKPVLEVLAGVPTVVYGFFAVLVVAPAFRGAGDALGVAVSPNTALAAGTVMAIMLIPFISSFTDDALAAVPQALRDGSLALGATRTETMLKVLFPAAIPGIVGGILLAVSRAIGETMIVVMAAGLIAKLTINPLDSVTTVTVQIVTLLIGDTSFDSPKTLAAFALGMMLFIVTLAINVLAVRIVRKYREIYE